MQRIWFTSDTHFGHKGALRFRPFASLEEMDETMIKNWNRYVAQGDLVYHLGDFSLAKPDRTLEILDQLHGSIYLIRGNHDSVADHSRVRGRFVWIKDYHYLRIEDQYIALSHYPFMTWRNSHHGSWHLHGHCHGNLTAKEGLRMDVGADCWQFAPIDTADVHMFMTGRSIEVVDHHNPADLTDV